MLKSFPERLLQYSRLLVLSHSVFALPFAISGFALAWHKGVLIELPGGLLLTAAEIILAVVAARCAAMSFNRLIDAEIDSANPRTAGREIPAGTVSKGEAVGICLLSSAAFLTLSALIGRHCLYLAPLVLAVLLGYSLAKRFTPFAHMVLGLALALAPGGAWWALRPEIELTPLLLMTAVLSWVAGFDLLYAAQDVLFDRQRGIHSLVALFGIEYGFAIAKLLHIIFVALLLLVGLSEQLSFAYWAALMLSALLLLKQHRDVSPFDISGINRKFFTYNGALSFLFLVGVLIAVF